MSLAEIQQKRQIIESRSRIREFVFGIQDGLISTVGLLAGVQGATENKIVVIVTGFTAMFSGAISMAAGSYLSSLAHRRYFQQGNHRRGKNRRARAVYRCRRAAQSPRRRGFEQGTKLPDGQGPGPGTKRIHAHLSGKSLRFRAARKSIDRSERLW